MHLRGGQLVLSPTDLTKHLACAHTTTLDRLKLEDKAMPSAADDALELIFRLGMEHEKRYLASLVADGKSVVEIGDVGDGVTAAQRERETVDAMRSGADVVYQGTFDDGLWTGRPDFLLRSDGPSAFGSWHYEIADTKLARRLKVAALLQMATYADRLGHLQGVAPERLYVVTGDGENRPWRLVDVAAFARRARLRLREVVDVRPETLPVPTGYCGQCRWLLRCDRHWRETDDLSRVAFMRGDHRHTLRAAGVTTLEALAGLSADELPRDIGRTSRERLTHQASLQLWERQHGMPRYDLLPPVAAQGLLRLPPPSEGDLYLDFEGDPYAEQGEGREYLAGLGDTKGGFEPIWAHSPVEERALAVGLVGRLLDRWDAYPDMHVYHYAPYETTALKRLVARHGVSEDRLDQLLRGERFVDLYAVVRQGLRISKGSYSIKKMEAFYWGAVRNNNPDVADALSSVIAYERWIVDRDETTLPAIEAYNRDDVLSTRDLHRWLEERRAELEALHGVQLRPGGEPSDRARPPGEAELAEIALAAELEAAGETLLAGLVQFHRREARPAYWDLFRLEALDDDEMVDDSSAIGALSPPQDVGADKRSRLYRYDFPSQDTKVTVGDIVYDVDTRKPAGTVTSIEADSGYLVVKRAGPPVHSRAFTEKQVLGDAVIRSAIGRVGRDRLGGVDCLGSALLECRVPRVLADVTSSGVSLSGQVLAVQGPPGSGKTRRGAELIRALIDSGKTVGITANSHTVIGHLLAQVGRPGVQKCDADQFGQMLGVRRAGTNAEVLAELAAGCQLVGGTAWLWSREELEQAVDVLVVEEAGQFSLANAVGVSRAARSMVLLGDPQQLPQPTQALHPHGAGVSALGHFIGQLDTIPEERGIFLGTTWRMHPALTRFVSEIFYDGRLHSERGLEHQRVDAGPGLDGSGVRVVEAVHEGNEAASAQEAAEIERLWRRLVAGSFTDRSGVTRGMTADDVLVVAPYNNQVGLLKQRLPGARIGTVDKFQGQEAPVVIYSMTSSSAADAPRGVSFLYDIHRLNVAVSRAQAMAIVVMCPRLLDADVATPEQLRAVNALCRLVETAHATSPSHLRPPS